MKTFIANFISFVFLFTFIIFIAIISSGKFWISILAFAGIYVFWQILKRVIIWSDPEIENEI